MWYALIIFGISALSLLGFLAYKLSKLRRQEIVLPPEATAGYIPLLVEDVRGRIEYTARTGMRITLLFLLKHSVRAMHVLKRKTDKVVAQAHAFAKHHEKRIVETHVADTAGNGFLETIGEYKKKIARPRKRISSDTQ